MNNSSKKIRRKYMLSTHCLLTDHLLVNFWLVCSPFEYEVSPYCINHLNN
ncbi:hypothetical protein Xkoz_01038 [Xenorhabdus kozodoii]|uniref:Uncharacterized protein n=1 Tax=Xenorhabdus kozodoii TaxID=351676 RepID=A0A2D0LEW5_9GAMM|nr:hypothetical protein Xkoz_01038 [Xenorhabdus kozodoii]